MVGRSYRDLVNRIPNEEHPAADRVRRNHPDAVRRAVAAIRRRRIPHAHHVLPIYHAAVFVPP